MAQQGEWADKVTRSQGQALVGKSWLEGATSGREEECGARETLPACLGHGLAVFPSSMSPCQCPCVYWTQGLCHMDKQGSEGTGSRKGSCVQS